LLLAHRLEQPLKSSGLEGDEDALGLCGRFAAREETPFDVVASPFGSIETSLHPELRLERSGPEVVHGQDPRQGRRLKANLQISEELIERRRDQTSVNETWSALEGRSESHQRHGRIAVERELHGRSVGIALAHERRPIREYREVIEALAGREPVLKGTPGMRTEPFAGRLDGSGGARKLGFRSVRGNAERDELAESTRQPALLRPGPGYQAFWDFPEMTCFVL
jgi:hypothetical protein